MDVPGPWEALILAAAVYRVWRLLSEDTILTIPRHRLVRLPDDWEDGDTIPVQYRLLLAKFISCVYCLGFWISLAAWLLWQLTPHWTVVFAFPLALSAAVAAIASLIDKDE